MVDRATESRYSAIYVSESDTASNISIRICVGHNLVAKIALIVGLVGAVVCTVKN